MQHTIARWVDRLREEYADAVAILLKGSYARGDAATWSDIDFDVLVSTQDVEDYRTWIEPVGDRLVHISAAVEWVTGWERDTVDPSSWSYGLPTQETTRLMWAINDETRRRMDRPYKTHPAAEPEVENTVEALGKIRNAIARGDDLGVYQSAQTVAKLVPTLLIPINPPVTVSHARQAIEAILAFPRVPVGFAADWLTCLGLVEERSARSTAAAAERMVRGVLEMLPTDPDLLGEDIARLMNAGLLEKYVQQ
uniref:Aminoglycoside nucleotidyltransferase n=1 Tax=Pseudomonas aeruginosa TaxID=287 RepID=Q83V96_PSEAI|nr:aminoglycoside nucleotidyltransferase ANT(4')-IIb [Pseudomonas aeruginosa]AAM76670.1 aminoglycoside nucleotidyltransferase [Pseudomonas aeruginosa]